MARFFESLKIKHSLLAIPVGAMIVMLGATGCSALNERVLPANLESRMAEGATADDHFAAAMLYQQEAQKQAEQAAAYEKRVDALAQHVDPKGFRRAGLITAAQEHRKEAAAMQQLYAAHHTKALTMTGKQDAQ